MSGASDKLADVTARVDFDAEAELAAIRELAAGPPVVLVAGPPRDDRANLAAWLTETLPKATVRVADVAGADTELWDVLVLGSAADRLLPADEQAILAAPARDGRTVLVAVTGAHRLGAGPELAAARAELERLRLRPYLTPLGLRWWFLDPAVTDDGLAAEVTQRCQAGDVHNAGVRVALQRVGLAAKAHCAPRLERRRHDLDLLDSMRQQVGPAADEARERTRIRAMAAEDELRDPVDRFYEQVIPACERALTWLGSGCITPWEDVVHPLEKSWEAVLDDAPQALGRNATELHEDLDRTVQAQLRRTGQLGIDVEPPSFTRRQWPDAAIAEPLDRLTGADIGAALSRFAKEVGKFVPPDDDRKRISQIVRRHDVPDPDRLAAGLDRDLRAIVQGRATDAARAIRGLIETEGGADSAAVADWLESTTDTTADAVEERHRWYAAYHDLLDLLDRL
jgi:hypothetical protein